MFLALEGPSPGALLHELHEGGKVGVEALLLPFGVISPRLISHGPPSRKSCTAQLK